VPVRIIGIALAASILLTVFIAPTASATTRFGWSNLGGSAQSSAINAPVRAIAVSGSDVYVGGMFSSAGGVASADYVAKWNGTSWSALPNSSGGSALNSRVNAILIDGTNVIVGGHFQNAGGDPQADYLAVWNGSTWSDIANATTGDGALSGEVSAIAKSGSDLYVGGVWYNAPALGGVSGNAGDNIVRWDGTNWHALSQRSSGDGALQGWVNALIATPTGVIAGGGFLNVADGVVDYLAEYRVATDDWVGVFGSDTEFNGEIRALHMSGNDLFVGGDFTDFAGMTAADYFVHWDDINWSAPGGAGGTSAIRSKVYSIVGSGSDVYVGGDFQNAGVGSGQKPTADRVAKWNGTGWSALGSNGSGDGALNDNFDEFEWVRALALGSNSVIVGGRFRNAATVEEADYIASFTPPSASPRPDGRIKKGSGTLVGNDVYNTTGDSQTRIGAAARGNTIKFTLSIQNDGGASGKFKVAATGAAASGYRVTYFRGSTNITSAVVAGAYQTTTVAPGNVFAITAKVKVLSGATVGSSVTRLVTISAVANPTNVDAVKLIGKRK
jgi:hypothetical protein